jgi:murein tripeptide amidase MpaA
MKRIALYLIVTVFSINCISAQNNLLTVAEQSDFTSTSRYDDVVNFIEKLKKSSPYIRTERIATSIEGREIPLIIIGNPLPKSPDDLRNDKRTVVYIQGNIHAGEVEGKEATLMFARDLLSEKKPALLQNVVVLLCPLINPDGNEKISKQNRTYQNGPVNGVGVRYNGQMLDLNRDGMKVESPEIRGLIGNVFNRWDPAVFMDCHTTDGSFHVEPVTFTWMVNPNTNRGLIDYMRQKMMPSISKTLLQEHKVENCFYGEFIDMMNPEKGWILDASEPRYISNYYGLRNRLGILNENYVYADYKSRVIGCYYLIRSLIEYVSTNSKEIDELISNADKSSVKNGLHPKDSFAIEYAVRALPEKVTIKTYEAEPMPEGSGYPDFKRTDRRKDVTVPYFIDYYPLKSVMLPFAYMITVKDPAVLDVLKLHGIKIEKLTSEQDLMVDNFIITSLKPSESLNQGHYTHTIEGIFRPERIKFPEGTYLVRMAQPLARLAAYLLEPKSNDGLVVWNYFDKYLVPQWDPGFNPFPVYKLMKSADLTTVPVN